MPRKRWVWFALVVLLAIAAGGLYYWRELRGAQEDTGHEELKTTTARRGDLVLSATGAGTLMASQDVELSFGASGVLKELGVVLGDQVVKGSVLARIDDLDARHAVTAAEVQVASAAVNLQSALQSHEDLVVGASAGDLLQAEAELLEAQEALEDLETGASDAALVSARASLATARDVYRALLDGPDPGQVQRAELDVARAKNSLWSSQMSRDAKGNDRDKESGAYDQAQVSVLNAEISLKLAEMSLAELTEPATAAEVAEALAKVRQAEEALEELEAGPSPAALAAAKARVTKASEALDDLRAGAGPEDVALSEAKVRQAELNVTEAGVTLDSAQQALQETALYAPFDATVTQVDAEVGEYINANSAKTIMVLSDLKEPVLEVYIDEADRDLVALGYPVEVTFDAKPDLVLNGRIIRLDPTLSSQGGIMAIRALVVLDDYAPVTDLLAGSSATVDVIAARAENAVLVPLQALRDLGDGDYGVFVVEDGAPSLRLVQVGIKDVTYAEIRSGLTAGAVVSTGIMETR